VDKIGVVRDHRWASADKQAERLAPICRKVVSLGGGKLQQIDRDGLVMLGRSDREFVLCHAFLLTEPKRKRLSGGMRKDFRAVMAALDARGAQVFDLEADTGSDKRKAFLAVVDADIGNSNRGRHSRLNGAKSTRGRIPADFTPAQYEKAGDIWGNTKRYPEEKDTVPALAKIVSARGHKFTKYRARAKFGGRT
jgi:hypothetical protein